MILLADSGSTKTDWRLLDKSGEKGQVNTVGFNPYYQDTDSIYAELKKSLLPHIQDVKPTEVHFYGAGCSSPEKVKIVADAIQKAFPGSKVHVEHDLLAAARGLCGHEAGMPCILGTGCNSAVFDGKNITANVPSLGFMLGDEGSGGYIGKHLVQLYLNEEMPVELLQAFAQKFNVTRDQILDQIYYKPYPNRYLASFSPFASEHHDHPYIRQVLQDDFQMFFKRQLGKYPEHTSLTAHFTGSVAFYNADILKEVAAKNNVAVGQIVRSPMANLVKYHLDLIRRHLINRNTS